MPVKHQSKSLTVNRPRSTRMTGHSGHFQFRRTLSCWCEEIKKAGPETVLVFCSKGKGARDPKSERKLCNYYEPVGEIRKRIPDGVQIPHPMGNKTKASAFIVERVIYPASFEPETLEWLKKNNGWQTKPLPTRPEFLVRPGKGPVMRPIRAILKLKAPYLAEVGIDVG
jgi:hypothetical protein